MSLEETDLATHTAICAIRYQGIQEKMDGLEKRLDKVEDTLTSLKTQNEQNFTEIKVLLERNAGSKQTALITAIGGVFVAIIGVIGYLVTKH